MIIPHLFGTELTQGLTQELTQDLMMLVLTFLFILFFIFTSCAERGRAGKHFASSITSQQIFVVGKVTNWRGTNIRKVCYYIATLQLLPLFSHFQNGSAKIIPVLLKRTK